ncbi:tyrosine-type recombinase/integrase [Bradyrhizobium sp. 139]|uniref:tyrosine-type recombinase/integrase n=1 Tax=Bradyrhizobium sp. 139 TaxID=2782616 RepID=UPI002112986F|nr:tyrosine-type recombinase/integrase [Bradyrhizobium sp. 139]
MRRWKLATLPTFLPAAQVRKALDSCDRETVMGRRDYAILLLLAKLGLRADEVATLTLDDIDWRASEILVRAKGRQRARMPTALDRVGIEGCAHRGAHIFRHGLATELLRSGATLSEIGQLLRHENHDTTRIYAKVDIDALRTLSLPWPGGVQ